MQAGLLTYPPSSGITPSQPGRCLRNPHGGQWLMIVKPPVTHSRGDYRGLTAAGTVQDSHLVPSLFHRLPQEPPEPVCLSFRRQSYIFFHIHNHFPPDILPPPSSLLHPYSAIYNWLVL